jgi:phosphatidylglycerophosphate synthase
VAGLLIPSGVSPNAVSVMGVAAMGLAAACYLGLAWPWGVLAGFVFHLGWHVLDGADGDLARRTGRSSTSGEIVDGICDHVSHLILYGALGWMLSGQIGAWAWAAMVLAGASRGLQSSCYEDARRSYRRWALDSGSIRQTLQAERARSSGLWGKASTALAAAYLGWSRLVRADDRQVDAAMARLVEAGDGQAKAARDLYRRLQRPQVKRASVLSTNYETLAVAACLLAGSPGGFFAVEIILLNLAMMTVILVQRGVYRRLLEGLARIEAGDRPA